MYRDAGCLQCHRMAGEGGGIGPDLTNLGERRNRREILESIVDPSKVIASEFALTIIHMSDGRMWEGRIEHEDDHVLLLRQASSFAAPLELRQAEIEDRVIAPHSMMPSGLLNSWEPSQIADLLAYLLQPKANTLPAVQK